MGIKAVKIGEQDIRSGQAVKLASLGNIPVYGILANGRTIIAEADIDEASNKKVTELLAKGLVYSDIKWIYAQVTEFSKNGIGQYGRWFNDTNQNEVKDEGETFIHEKNLADISGADEYNVGKNFGLGKNIKLGFKSVDHLQPTMHWVEPFLVHPESIHTNTRNGGAKGCFVVAIDQPQVTLLDIAYENILQGGGQEAYNGQIINLGESLLVTLEGHRIPNGHYLSIQLIDPANKSVVASREVAVAARISFADKPDVTDYLWRLNMNTETVSLFIDPEKKSPAHPKNGVYTYELQAWYDPDSLMNKFRGQNFKDALMPKSSLDNLYVANPRVDQLKREQAAIPKNIVLRKEIKIKDDDLKKIIGRRNELTNMMVQVKPQQLKAAGNNPCCYTVVSVESADRPALEVFNEKGLGANYNGQPLYEVTAGEGQEYAKEVLVKANISDEKCRKGIHTTPAKVFVLNAQKAQPQWLKENVNYWIEAKQIKLKLDYKYNKTSLFPFNYFWLSASDAQPYSIPVETCRYLNDVQINVYPDMKWEVKFEYSCKYPIKYRDTWVKMRDGRVTDAVNKAQGADLDGYDGTLDTKFKIGIGVSWNNEKTKREFSYEWEKKIAAVIRIFLKVKQIANSIVGDNENGGAIKRMPAYVQEKVKLTAVKIGRLPAVLEISSPGLSFQLTWSNAARAADPKNELATELEATFGFSPLIGGKGTLDLIACAKFIPPLSGIIESVDRALGILGLTPTFTFSAVGELHVNGNVKFNYSERRGLQWIKNEIGTGGSKFGIEVYLGVKGEWKVKKWILWGDAKHDVSVEASAKAESYFKTNVSLGADRMKGPYIEAKVDFTGIKIVLEVSSTVNSSTWKKAKDVIILEEKKDIISGKHYFKNDTA